MVIPESPTRARSWKPTGTTRRREAKAPRSPTPKASSGSASPNRRASKSSAMTRSARPSAGATSSAKPTAPSMPANAASRPAAGPARKEAAAKNEPAWGDEQAGRGRGAGEQRAPGDGAGCLAGCDEADAGPLRDPRFPERRPALDIQG